MFRHPGLPRSHLWCLPYILPPQAWVPRIFTTPGEGDRSIYLYILAGDSYLFLTPAGDCIYFSTPCLVSPYILITLGWGARIFLSPRRVTAYLFTVHHAWCLHIIYPPWRVLHIFIHPRGGVRDPSSSTAFFVVVVEFCYTSIVITCN